MQHKQRQNAVVLVENSQLKEHNPLWSNLTLIVKGIEKEVQCILFLEIDLRIKTREYNQPLKL